MAFVFLLASLRRSATPGGYIILTLPTAAVFVIYSRLLTISASIAPCITRNSSPVTLRVRLRSRLLRISGPVCGVFTLCPRFDRQVFPPVVVPSSSGFMGVLHRPSPVPFLRRNGRGCTLVPRPVDPCQQQSVTFICQC